MISMQCRARKVPEEINSGPLSVKLYLSTYFTICYISVGFPGGSDDKESACNVGGLCLIPGLERSPGGGHGNPLQYSCLENSMDGGAWQATVHGVAKNQTRLKQLSTCEYNCGVHQERWSKPKVPKGQVEFRKIENSFE